MSAESWSWHSEPGTESWTTPLIDGWDRLEQARHAEILKQNPLRTVIALPATATRPSLIVKRYHLRNLREQLKYLVVESRAASEWSALRHLAGAGVEVPRVLASGEERRRGLLVRAGLLMERVVDTVIAPRWLDAEPDRARRSAMMFTCGGSNVRSFFSVPPTIFTAASTTCKPR